MGSVQEMCLWRARPTYAIIPCVQLGFSFGICLLLCEWLFNEFISFELCLRSLERSPQRNSIGFGSHVRENAPSVFGLRILCGYSQGSSRNLAICGRYLRGALSSFSSCACQFLGFWRMAWLEIPYYVQSCSSVLLAAVASDKAHSPLYEQTWTE